MMIPTFKKHCLLTSTMFMMAVLIGGFSLAEVFDDGYVEGDGNFVFCNSFQEVLEWKDADVGKPFPPGATVSEKDDAGKIGRYLFTVETVSDRKMYKRLDLTEKTGLWNMAILVDDATTVTVIPQDGTPPTVLRRCQGSALWSDAAFHALSYNFRGGKTYRINFDYSNTCHLPHPETMEDYDGIIAYLYPSGVDLDADLDGDGDMDADDEAKEETPGGFITVGKELSPLRARASGLQGKQIRLRWTSPDLVEVKQGEETVTSGLVLTPDSVDSIYNFTVKARSASVAAADVAFTLEAVDFPEDMKDKINFTLVDLDLDADSDNNGVFDRNQAEEDKEENPGVCLAKDGILTPLRIHVKGCKGKEVCLSWPNPEKVEVKRNGTVVASGLKLVPDSSDKIYDLTVKGLVPSAALGDVKFVLELADASHVKDVVNVSVIGIDLFVNQPFQTIEEPASQAMAAAPENPPAALNFDRDFVLVRLNSDFTTWEANKLAGKPKLDKDQDDVKENDGRLVRTTLDIQSSFDGTWSLSWNKDAKKLRIWSKLPSGEVVDGKPVLKWIQVQENQGYLSKDTGMSIPLFVEGIDGSDSWVGEKITATFSPSVNPNIRVPDDSVWAAVVDVNAHVDVHYEAASCLADALDEWTFNEAYEDGRAPFSLGKVIGVDVQDEDDDGIAGLDDGYNKNNSTDPDDDDAYAAAPLVPVEINAVIPGDIDRRLYQVRLAVPANVVVWKKASKRTSADIVVSGVYPLNTFFCGEVASAITLYMEATSNVSGNLTVLLEPIGQEALANTTNPGITAKIPFNYRTLVLDDGIKTAAYPIDLDIDSDNYIANNLVEDLAGRVTAWQWPAAEDVIEDSKRIFFPGKIIPLAENDANGDGKPDFADLASPHEMAVVTLVLPGGLDPSVATINLSYSDSDPSGVRLNANGEWVLPGDTAFKKDGCFRLWNYHNPLYYYPWFVSYSQWWTAVLQRTRNLNEYVAPGTYRLEAFGVNVGRVTVQMETYFLTPQIRE